MNSRIQLTGWCLMMTIFPTSHDEQIDAYWLGKISPNYCSERQVFLYTPKILTWNLKIMVAKRTFLFQGLIFRFHVKISGVFFRPHHQLW